jgi:hypothetical protein
MKMAYRITVEVDNEVLDSKEIRLIDSTMVAVDPEDPTTPHELPDWAARKVLGHLKQGQLRDFLRSLGNVLVADVYDTDPRVGEALEAIRPGFEYPDISCLTCAEAASL